MSPILKAVKDRRSIRAFRTIDISADLQNKLIEALIWAPSAGNMQSRKFYFIYDKNIKKELGHGAHQEFVAEAPLVIVGCTDNKISARYGNRGVNLYSIQDVAVSIMAMMLVAHEYGLGTVWIGSFLESRVISLLNIPDNLRPVVICPVGYPSRIPQPRSRVTQDEAIIFIR